MPTITALQSPPSMLPKHCSAKTQRARTRSGWISGSSFSWTVEHPSTTGVMSRREAWQCSRPPALSSRPGAALPRGKLYDSLTMLQCRQTRYRIDDEILANARAAMAAAEQVCGENDLAWANFMMGFTLLWRGELARPRKDWRCRLRPAERTGDVVLRARALCYLNVAALRRHDADTVRHLAPEGWRPGKWPPPGVHCRGQSLPCLAGVARRPL